MRNPPPFREAVRDWFQKLNTGPEGKPVFSDSEIKRRSGVARSTLDRIRDMDADVDEDTLAKLAAIYPGHPPRIVKALQVEQGTLQEPRSALGWIGEARAALDAAERLLYVEAKAAAAPAPAATGHPSVAVTLKAVPEPPAAPVLRPKRRTQGKGKG